MEQHLMKPGKKLWVPIKAPKGELLERVAQSDLKSTNTVGIWYMNLVTQAS